MKFISLLILIACFSVSWSATVLDLATPTSSFVCFEANGISQIVARGYQSFGGIDTAAK
jgi:hypothetical protein